MNDVTPGEAHYESRTVCFGMFDRHPLRRWREHPVIGTLGILVNVIVFVWGIDQFVNPRVFHPTPAQYNQLIAIGPYVVLGMYAFLICFSVWGVVTLAYHIYDWRKGR